VRHAGNPVAKSARRPLVSGARLAGLGVRDAFNDAKATPVNSIEELASAHGSTVQPMTPALISHCSVNTDVDPGGFSTGAHSGG
jgi:hypothetical protein